MSISRTELLQAFDSLLQPERFKDYGPNGLQVEGKAEISRIVSGVTASRALIDAAIAAQADAIFVHHGLFWRGQDGRVTGWMKQRLQLLLAHDINLFAYHLPLDAHPELGNNAQLGRVLGLVADARFGENDLGFAGPAAFADGQALADHVAQALGRPVTWVPPEGAAAQRPVCRVAWCTGGAQGYFEAAIAAGITPANANTEIIITRDGTTTASSNAADGSTGAGSARPPVDAANPRANNVYGGVIRWRENGKTVRATAFTWDLFIQNGDTATAKAPLPTWLWHVLHGMTFSGWVATVAGWYVTEIGRQPYIVQGVLRTADAVTRTPAATVGWSLAGYLVVYTGLLIAYIGVLRYLAIAREEGAQFCTGGGQPDRRTLRPPGQPGDTGSRGGHAQIERGPCDREQPVRRVPAGFAQGLVPVAGREQHADRGAGGQHDAEFHPLPFPMRQPPQIGARDGAQRQPVDHFAALPAHQAEPPQFTIGKAGARAGDRHQGRGPARADRRTTHRKRLVRTTGEPVSGR